MLVIFYCWGLATTVVVLFLYNCFWYDWLSLYSWRGMWGEAQKITVDILANLDLCGRDVCWVNLFAIPDHLFFERIEIDSLWLRISYAAPANNPASTQQRKQQFWPLSGEYPRAHTNSGRFQVVVRSALVHQPICSKLHNLYHQQTCDSCVKLFDLYTFDMDRPLWLSVKHRQRTWSACMSTNQSVNSIIVTDADFLIIWIQCCWKTWSTAALRHV